MTLLEGIPPAHLSFGKNTINMPTNHDQLRTWWVVSLCKRLVFKMLCKAVMNCIPHLYIKQRNLLSAPRAVPLHISYQISLEAQAPLFYIPFTWDIIYIASVTWQKQCNLRYFSYFRDLKPDNFIINNHRLTVVGKYAAVLSSGLGSFNFFHTQLS